MNEKQPNKMTKLIWLIDAELEQITTKGMDTMHMAKARKILVEAEELAKTLVMFDEDTAFKPKEENKEPET